MAGTEVRPLWPRDNPVLSSAAIVGATRLSEDRTIAEVRLWVRVRQEGRYWLFVSQSRVSTTGKPRAGDDGKTLVVTQPSGQEERFSGALFVIDDIAGDRDLTSVAMIRDLDPGTRYHYVVFADFDRPDTSRWEIGEDRESGEDYSFRTPATDPEETVFALYGCHKPYRKRSRFSRKIKIVNMEVWDFMLSALRDLEADFVLGTGDQVYADGGDQEEELNVWLRLKREIRDRRFLHRSEEAQRRLMVSWYRNIYRWFWGFPGVQRVFRNYPMFMIWDDHEVMDGWGSHRIQALRRSLRIPRRFPGTRKEKRELKERLVARMIDSAKEVFREYQHCHNPSTPGEDVYDYSFDHGCCAFYVLDMRSHRDFENGKEGEKVLGRQQMERLKAWLRDQGSRAATEVLFILSPVPVVHMSHFVTNLPDCLLLGAKDDLRDEWAHRSNRKERDVMLDAVFEVSDSSGKPVIFLSGDVHIGVVFDLSRESAPRARVHQFTSSAITWESISGKLLDVLVKTGTGPLSSLPGTPPEKKTVAKYVTSVHLKNFGLIRVRRAEDGVKVEWALRGLFEEGEDLPWSVDSGWREFG